MSSKKIASWTSASDVSARKLILLSSSQPTRLCEPRPASIRHSKKPYAVLMSASLMSQKRPARNGATCANPNEPKSGKAEAVFASATWLVENVCWSFALRDADELLRDFLRAYAPQATEASARAMPTMILPESMSARASASAPNPRPMQGHAMAAPIITTMAIMPAKLGVAAPRKSIFKTETKASGTVAIAANALPKIVWPVLFVRPSRMRDFWETSTSSISSISRSLKIAESCF